MEQNWVPWGLSPPHPEGLDVLQGRVLAREQLHLQVSHSHCLDICLHLATSLGDLSCRATGPCLHSL